MTARRSKPKRSAFRVLRFVTDETGASVAWFVTPDEAARFPLTYRRPPGAEVVAIPSWPAPWQCRFGSAS
jgi:hypothetical protein